jgi:hypothetical protein
MAMATSVLGLSFPEVDARNQEVPLTPMNGHQG